MQILSCYKAKLIQCKTSHFHPAQTLDANDRNLKLRCCNVAVESINDPFIFNGCATGLHRSAHHTDYPYINYLLHWERDMEDREAWFEVEQKDVNEYRAGHRLGEFGRLRSGESFFKATASSS